MLVTASSLAPGLPATVSVYRSQPNPSTALPHPDHAGADGPRCPQNGPSGHRMEAWAVGLERPKLGQDTDRGREWGPCMPRRSTPPFALAWPGTVGAWPVQCQYTGQNQAPPAPRVRLWVFWGPPAVPGAWPWSVDAWHPPKPAPPNQSPPGGLVILILAGPLGRVWVLTWGWGVGGCEYPPTDRHCS